MRVLVTGANGFIGSAIVRALVGRGDEVFSADLPGANSTRLESVAGQYRAVDLDVTDHAAAAKAVAEVKPERIVHLAWYAVPGKYPSSPENVSHISATLELMKAAKEAEVEHFVGIGTCFEYDFASGTMHEESPTEPASLYAACKLATYTAAMKLAETIELPTAWARFFYQYGPFEDERRLVASLTSKLLRGEPAPSSTGEQVRDFLHVDDDASGILAVLDAKLTGAVNVGSGVPVTVREIAETIGELTGRGELIDFGAFAPRPGDPPKVVADSRRLTVEGEWKPKFDLRSGLADTVDWWREELKRRGELKP